MIYAVLYEYVREAEKITRVRPSHRQYLTKLLEAGNLVAAGPCTDDSGALIIYQASDETQLRQFITGDPFHQEGVFLRWTVKPWKPVFGNHALIPNGPPA
jgi:uncharacterized protein YciI